MTPADEPALEDDTTARLFEMRVQYVRNQTWTWLCVAAGLVLVAGQWSRVPLLAVAFSACLLMACWQVLSQERQPSQRWIPAARRLLEDEPWRETGWSSRSPRRPVPSPPGSWRTGCAWRTG